MKRAVVIFSGGQDSTTCLIQTIQFYDDVHCITFDYGQLHREEITVSIELVRKLNIRVHKIMDIKLLNELAVSSLTRSSIPIPIYIPNNRKLSTTFVPGRNILFLTLASIYAYQVESEVVISGICETDFSGYPDCCNEFITLFNNAICLGMARNIRFETPLMWLNKAETWALADYWHQLPMVRDETLTCYNGIRGNGCRKCAACYLRARGLDNYLANSVNVMAQMKQKIGL